ncbi:MAG: type II toxin-antitoxin system VapC family toxin [Nonlabens sp.]
MRYLLDTNICIYFLRGRLDLDEIFREVGIENCAISELTVFELKFGAENSEHPKKSHQAVNRFIAGLTIIPIYGVVEKYAQEKVRLRKNGTPLHDEFDLIIGLTAVVNDLIVVTENLKDFKNIKNLKTENWYRIK